MNKPKLINIIPMHDFKLHLEYEDNEFKVFDVLPYIDGDWYGKLKNRQYFMNVHISNNTVVWQEGQDIAPHELYEYSFLIK